MSFLNILRFLRTRVTHTQTTTSRPASRRASPARWAAGPSGTAGVTRICRSVQRWNNSGMFRHCEFLTFFRTYKKIYYTLAGSGLTQLTNLTSCRKPCTYKRYSLVSKYSSSFTFGQNLIFGLKAALNMTMMEKEQLIYPLTSLVAEFGGTLGLFLGFSFMTVWDGMQYLQGRIVQLSPNKLI